MKEYDPNPMIQSGALAELLVVNRDLITLAPDCGISVEQIASLPAAGILAVQAMETLCNELPRGSKVSTPLDTSTTPFIQLSLFRIGSRLECPRRSWKSLHATCVLLSSHSRSVACRSMPSYGHGGRSLLQEDGRF